MKQINWNEVLTQLITFGFMLGIGLGSYHILIWWNPIPKNVVQPTVNPMCAENEYSASDWGICSDSGIQTRIITPVSERAKNNSCIIQEKTSTGCIIPPPEKKRLSLFRIGGYTTQVDTSIENGYYENNENLSITSSGKIKSLKLELTAKTSIADGSLIQRPVYYYLLFAINENTPRILGTTRSADGNISYTGNGIFSGMETPKTLTFDLSNQQLANAKKPSEGAGSTKRNYVDILNKNTGKPLIMSLYVGNGRSMNEPDINKRIFGTITEAYLEYECEKGSQCNISRN